MFPYFFPGNHLDHLCVEALSEAITKWDVKSGALIVVSHDRNFCEKIDFTHIATVQNGKFTIEERSARESDWYIDTLFTASDGSHSNESKSVESKNDATKKDLDPKVRKLLYNAPKRIKKLEEMVEKAEEKIAKLETDMLDCGHDVGKLTQLTKEKEALEANVDKYETEWDELETLISKYELVAA